MVAAADESKKKQKVDRLRWLVLSDVLRAEINGSPIDWARYCAKYPNRTGTLNSLSADRSLESLENNRWGVTFSGLLLARSAAAKSVLSDCRRVYNVLRAHYRKHVYDQITVKELASKIRPQRPLERVVFALSMLTRDSGANINVQGRPITAESKVNGNQNLLEASFAKRVKERKEQLSRQSIDRSVGGAAGNRPLMVPWGQRTDATWLYSVIDEVGGEDVRATWRKCMERGMTDPDGAITAARSLIESVCKQILEGRGVAYGGTGTLLELFALVRKELALDPSTAVRGVQTILQGCATVVSGLAELRNVLGDSHGKSTGSPRASQRHARLACAAGGTMAAFLLATDEGRRLP